jgi:hypothetical protein
VAELIISEITLMSGGFCVIGLEQHGDGFRSIRPMPWLGHAWSPAFPFHRGDILRVDLDAVPVVPPHLEDRKARGPRTLVRHEEETQLVRCLRRAEMAKNLGELFGCSLRESPTGGNAVWAEPAEARRSVAGGEFHRLHFLVRGDRFRVELTWSSGEVLRSLPLVDRDWNHFLTEAHNLLQGVNQAQRFQRFLNQTIEERIFGSSDRFVRIGLARPMEGHCWLMLDSLFPEPRREWLKGLV